MLESLPLVKLAVMVAIGPGFVNGFNDSPNAIATAIGARFLSPSLPLSWRLFAILLGQLPKQYLEYPLPRISAKDRNVK